MYVKDDDEIVVVAAVGDVTIADSAEKKGRQNDQPRMSRTHARSDGRTRSNLFSAGPSAKAAASTPTAAAAVALCALCQANSTLYMLEKKDSENWKV